MIMSRNLKFTGIFGGGISVLAIVLSLSAPANAIELFGETFDTNTVDLTSTLSTYSNFSYTGNGDAVVQNGQFCCLMGEIMAKGIPSCVMVRSSPVF